uniref:Uncharacterized protein n=1 Tax=Magallana gigas TaxID=29159 RepID=K1REW6_MAGGI
METINEVPNHLEKVSLRHFPKLPASTKLVIGSNSITGKDLNCLYGQSWLDDSGSVPRQHGNQGRKPKHAVNFDDVRRVVNFNLSYAEEYGLPQPAAPRGRDDEPPIFLPCDSSKKRNHSLYKSAYETDDVRKVEYHTFTSIWTSCCSHIKMFVPCFDVCHWCEVLRRQVLDACKEEEKLAALNEF